VTAIEQLGELLHASLREDGREEITVEEEVALAERYLALQGMRFGDRLRYEWHVAPEVSECLVPVLLLQPIVENAVVHGLDAGQESLAVRVEAFTPEGWRSTLKTTDGNEGKEQRQRAKRTFCHWARLLTAHGDRASLGGARWGGVVRIVLWKVATRRRATAATHDASSWGPHRRR
jgi:LytS/YehU family sensor histidine kinase